MRWILTMVMIGTLAAACAKDAPPPPTTEKDRLSYALGMDLGAQLKDRSVDIDPAVFARGLEDALSGSKTVLTEDEAKAAITKLQLAQAAKQTTLAKAVGEKNKAAGDAFMAANKAKPGVVTLPSGLQYKILTPGTGKTPKITDTVVCHSRGALIDGKEFHSTYKQGTPATFPVATVIKGWTEVLQLMPVGSKWQVCIPPNLAYGERGRGTDIEPNSTLVFEIELIAIK